MLFAVCDATGDGRCIDPFGHFLVVAQVGGCCFFARQWA
jgi:hypothetical protein